MAIESDSDRLAVLQALGELATFQNSPAAPWTAYAVFDNEYVDALDVEGASPILTVRTIDISAVVRGTTVAPNGETYNVVGIRPDGTGFTTLILAEGAGTGYSGGKYPDRDS